MTEQHHTADDTDGSNTPKVSSQGGVAGERLRSFVERIERLTEERKALNDDIKDVFGEAKATGFDVPTIRKVLKIRGMKEDDLDEQAALLETYLRALGMKTNAIV